MCPEELSAADWLAAAKDHGQAGHLAQTPHEEITETAAGFMAEPSCRPDHVVLLSNSGNKSGCLALPLREWWQESCVGLGQLNLL